MTIASTSRGRDDEGRQPRLDLLPDVPVHQHPHRLAVPVVGLLRLNLAKPGHHYVVVGEFHRVYNVCLIDSTEKKYYKVPSNFFWRPNSGEASCLKRSTFESFSILPGPCTGSPTSMPGSLRPYLQHRLHQVDEQDLQVGLIVVSHIFEECLIAVFGIFRNMLPSTLSRNSMYFSTP